MTSTVSGAARQELENAWTLPIAEARKEALGLARTQPLAAVSEPAPAQPRRVRPAAPLPVKSTVEPAKPIAQAVPPGAEPARPIAPAKVAPEPVRPIAQIVKPRVAPEPVKPIAQAVPPSAAPAKPIAQPLKVAPEPVTRIAPAARVAPEPVTRIAPKVAPEPVRPIAQAAPPAVEPAKPVPSVQVSAPSVRAAILPAAPVDDGWSQGRKRVARGEPAAPLRKLAEGTQPGVTKATLPAAVPRAAGKHATAVKSAPAPLAPAAERPAIARGTTPPPAGGKALPSLFSVIDRKKAEPQSSSPSRLPGLPPPPPARPSIGAKKAVSTVVAAASLGSAQMAVAVTRQTGQQVVPAPASVLLDDEVDEEIEEIEPDLVDFVAAPAVAAMRTRAPASPAPLFDAPPRALAVPPAATSFSAAEAAFFAAGEEMDTLDLDPEPDTFDDLPGIERPGFWSRLKRTASAGH